MIPPEPALFPEPSELRLMAAKTANPAFGAKCPRPAVRIEMVLLTPQFDGDSSRSGMAIILGRCAGKGTQRGRKEGGGAALKPRLLGEVRVYSRTTN